MKTAIAYASTKGAVREVAERICERIGPEALLYDLEGEQSEGIGSLSLGESDADIESLRERELEPFIAHMQAE